MDFKLLFASSIICGFPAAGTALQAALASFSNFDVIEIYADVLDCVCSPFSGRAHAGR